jgi:hypothetical protein
MQQQKHRDSYNVTSRTIQVSNRAEYNNNNNSNNINEVNINNDNNTSLI